MSTWFIHINQAVKKYNKTRQTFYNYINKGFVNTKKVNNKVFLNVEDIEKILNDYIEIEDSWTVKSKDNISNTTIDKNVKIISTIDTSRNETNSSKKQWFKNDFIENSKKLTSLFQHIEENIIRSNKSQLFSSQQILSWLIQNKHGDILTRISSLQHTVTKHSKRQRKVLFRMYYLVFISINIFILWRLS